MKSIIRKLLYEGLSDKLYYHGSKRDNINLSQKNDDPDYNMLGFGLYLTSLKKEAIHYAKDGGTGGYLYTFNLNGLNIVNWNAKVPKNIIDMVLSYVEKDEDDYPVEYRINSNVFYGLKETWLSEDNMFNSFANLYTYMYYILKSTRKASEFFDNLGIDGVKFRVTTTDVADFASRVPEIVVIYNDKKITPIKKDILK